MPVILAPLALVGVAVALFILAEAIIYMLRSIATALGSFNFAFIHIDFGQIFWGIVGPVVSLINLIASKVLNPIAGWFVGLVSNGQGIPADLVKVLDHQATQITHLHNVTIPDEVKQGVAEAATYTDTTVQGVRTQVHDAYTTWENAHSVADAEHYLALEASAPSVEHATLAIAARTLLAGENYADAQRKAAETYADLQIEGVSAYIDAQIIGLQVAFAQAIAIPTGAAVPSIDVEDIQTGAKVVTIGAAVAVIAAKIVECLVSNCPGNNNFTNLLNDALGLVAAAEFATFVEAFVNDPGGTLTSYVAPYESVIEGGATSVGGVWSSVESALGL